ncbi:7351_t:CDS:2 [Racocetra fulgida]|uniref:7351_t:CDS:1 n=1 Tax=Racocetra fulgida TaxID=60492 RepID=A0A9N8YWH0_9GLOM|nr:7351_t:CDS:2 [Racocetra fulgida]
MFIVNLNLLTSAELILKNPFSRLKQNESTGLLLSICQIKSRNKNRNELNCLLT